MNFSMKLDKSTEALGLLFGLLKKQDHDVLFNEELFSDPFAEIKKAPTRLHELLQVMETFFDPIKGIEFTSIDRAERWYAAGKKGAAPNGFCLFAPKSSTNVASGVFGLGVFDQFKSGSLTISTYARLPLLYLEQGQPAAFLISGSQEQHVQFQIDVYRRPKEGRAAEPGMEFRMISSRVRQRLGARFGPDFSIDFQSAFDPASGQSSQLGIGKNGMSAVLNTAIQESTTWLNAHLGDPRFLTIGDVLCEFGLIQLDTLDGDGKKTYRLKNTGFNRDDFVDSLKAVARKAADGIIQGYAEANGDGITPYKFAPDVYGLRFKLTDSPLMASRAGPKVSVSLGNDMDQSNPGFAASLLTVKNGVHTFTPELQSLSAGLYVTGGEQPLVSTQGFKLGGVRCELYFSKKLAALGLAGGSLRLDKLCIPLATGKMQGSGPAKEILSHAKELEKLGKNAEFSLSLSYIREQFEAQLYDGAGKPVDVVWLPVDGKHGPLSIQKFGIGLKKEGQGPALSLLLAGSLQLSAFQIDLLEAGLSLPFKNPGEIQPVLKGMNVAFKQGPVSISGGFLQTSPTEYAGQLSVLLPKCSINSLGVYGTRNGVTSLFIYGALAMGSGAGIRLGAITITGAALGVGINRRVKVPAIQEVRKFPLVSMVMRGGRDDKNMDSVLDEIKEVLPFEAGQYFGCAGLKFTIGEVIDAFALVIAQLGNDQEFNLLGLATFERKIPGRGLFCSVELALKLVLKPADGILLAQAELTSNSWVLDKDCHLTGGFALALWFDGPYKGEFVVSLGGYHPKFKPPSHYPVVPRLGLNWHVNSELTLKGEFYFAVTSSHLMAGGRLEATYRSEKIAAWFVAFIDFVMEWAPLRYEAEAGIAIRVQADTFLGTMDVSLGVSLALRGPEFSGTAVIDAKVISFVIEFGQSKPLPAIANWEEFGQTFLLKKTAEAVHWLCPKDKASAHGPALCQINLLRGLVTQPGTVSAEENRAGRWIVRADELDFSVSSVVPVTELQCGKVNRDILLAGVQDIASSGKHLVVSTPLQFETTSATPSVAGAAVGLRPLDVKTLRSRLNLALVKDEGGGVIAQDTACWDLGVDTMAMPAALWDVDIPCRDRPPKEPEAKAIAGCLVGLVHCRPPKGKTTGDPIHIKEWTRHPNEKIKISGGATSDEAGAPVLAEADVRALLKEQAGRRGQTAQMLKQAGFPMPATAVVDGSRRLRAKPLLIPKTGSAAN